MTSQIDEVLKSLPQNPGAHKIVVYVDRTPSDSILEEVQAKGWTVTDVRLIEDPVAYMEHYLDGVARGTIIPDDRRMKWFDAAMKVRGINNRKESDIKPKEKAPEDDLTVAELLGIKKKANEGLKSMYKHPNKRSSRPGRPKGAQDSVKRTKKKVPLLGFVLEKKVAKLRRLGKHAEAEKYLAEAAAYTSAYQAPPKV